MCIPTNLSYIQGCIYTFTWLMLWQCRELPLISSICCCLLSAVHLFSDWATNCLEIEYPLLFTFTFSSVWIYISQKVKELGFAIWKRALMRSLNFDDGSLIWHTFGHSYVWVSGKGSFTALNARQIVARQRFAGQKDCSMRLIRNSPDERLEGKLNIL